MARPTKYKKEYCKKVEDYLKTCEDVYEKVLVKDDNSYENGIETVNTRTIFNVNLPTIEGFALFLKVPVRCLYDWREKHEAFSQSLARIVAEQKNKLISTGLSGRYNPIIAKLILSSNHDMREKADMTTNGKDLPVPLLHVLRNNNSDPKTSQPDKEN